MVELESSLLEGLKTGQAAAYETFVEQFEGPLFRFFACDHLAQEQTAETFAQLVRSLPRMTGEAAQLPAFVFTVARRIKQRRWRRPVVRHLSIDAALDVSDGRPAPHARVENQEQQEQVMDTISQLETNSREAVLLRYVEGYSMDQIAAALETPVGTVKSLIHRAKQQIKQKLEVTEKPKGVNKNIVTRSPKCCWACVSSSRLWKVGSKTGV